MSGKGISPLIAAVILIAFVIAVAGIASTFFTGFTKEQASGVKSKATTIVDCSVAMMELDDGTVSVVPSGATAGNFSVVATNTGQEELAGLKVIIFNSTYAGTCIVSGNPTLSVGETETLANTSCANVPAGTITKIQLTTTTCAGTKSELTNYTTGTWRVTA